MVKKRTHFWGGNYNMNAFEIIELLRKHKVVPRLDGDQLKLTGETGNLPAELIEEVRNNKPELMAFLAEIQEELYHTAIPVIVEQPDYPLSNAQKRVWVAAQYEGGSVAYNITIGFYLKGSMSIPRLEQAFHHSISRHESLRTVFRMAAGEPRQFVLDDIPFQLSVEDVSSMTDVKEHIQQMAAAIAATAMDMENGPLVSARLCIISDTEYALILCAHHIICDGWSLNIFMQEVLHFYKNAPAPGAVEKPLRIQYKDYSAWLSEKTGNAAAAAFWKKQFEKPAEPLELPADAVRTAVKSFEGATFKIYFEVHFYEQITAFCNQHQLSVFNFFRAVFTLLLYKFSGQRNITIGTPVAGRNHAELQDLVGMFVNTIPLRTDVNPDETFLDLATRIARHTATASRFQDYPLDMIIDNLDIKRDISRNPLFDVVMMFQHIPVQHSGLDNSGAHVFEMIQLDRYLYGTSPVIRRNASSKFDLSLNFSSDVDNRSFLEWEYDSGLFSQETIYRYNEALRSIITQVIAQPDRTTDSIDIINEDERRKILSVFNHTPSAYASGATIIRFFEERVKRMPEQTALLSEGKHFSYGYLNEMANRLGDYLRKEYQLKADDRVAIKTGRSEWLIISILGVLKSGAAYVPVDPSYPEERARYILEDSGCRTILDEQELKRFAAIQDQYERDDLPSAATPDNLAYVIYTSGSTGTPKGVMVTHRNVVAFLENFGSRFGLRENMHLAATTNYTFDISVLELLGTIMSGIKVHLLADTDPSYVLGYISQHNINVLQVTPSRLNQLLVSAGGDMNAIAGLDVLLVGGESLGVHNYERLRTLVSTRVIHVYGPTETTIWSTSIELKADTVLSIGTPLLNEQVLILDTGLNLCPVGVNGEICISGAGVARGYLNRPELTADKFVSNEFLPGQTLYRTGDIGKWLPDGNILFTGRKDDQLKINGYRIEPAEIEAVLLKYRNIDTAVVTASVNAAGEQELVAYLVSKDDITITDIREYLSEHLPAYMVPVHYVQLPELPLTTSGKVDRKRLPSLAAGSLLSGAAYVAPRNTTEEQLVEIWQEVLGRGNIGIKDNFFDAGGHSLKATRLVSLVHRTFDVKLELKDVFTYVTPETQAGFIRHSRKDVFTSIPLAPEAADYPLSSSQRRLWVLSLFEESNVAYNMPGVYLFEGGLDRDALSAAFAELISRHEILRTVFRENTAGEIRQHILPSSTFRIDYLNLREAADQKEQLSELIRTAFATPFDLSEGPLLRAGLYEISSGQWVFVYVMHHIISDGWSMEVLIRELLELYLSSVEGIPQSLPSLRIQYKDYAVWQQSILTGVEPDTHKAYWLSEFSGELPVLSLLTDKPRPAIRTYNGGVIHRELDMQVYEGLKSLTGDHGSTLFMGLLAGVNVLLHRYTQQEDIIIGSPLAAREHIDLSDQIGFYANTLAIRSRFSGKDNYVHILEGVKEKTIGAYTHQAYPFDELVTSLSLQRDMSRHPLFDIEVILQQAVSVNRSGGDQAGELKVSPYSGVLPQQSRFDIVFNFTEDVSGLKLSIDYNIDLYEASTIARLAAHTEQMLSAIITSPYAAISGLDYLEAAERQQLLHTFNAANDPFPSADTLVSLFRRQVLLTPAAVAVVYGDKHLTYQELDEKSGLLASYIRTYNHFAQGSLVGVLQDRSELLLISILGILKAGGVYVPIDPSYPSSRKSFILSDTGARLLLTQTSYLFDVDYYEGDLFAMDVQLDGLQNVLSADVPIMGSDLAYVIYTSGSTGIPKGVMIDHGAISNTIRAQQEAFGTLPGERHLQFASSSFDASVSEIFVSLCSGGELHIIDDAMKQSPELLYGYISTQDISIATLPPAYLQQAFAHGLPALNKLVTAGEAAVVSQALSFGKQGIYYNAYGPTETSICATVFRLPSSWDGRSGIVPVGRPLPNVRIYILDEHHQLCPVGVAGEICIAGAGVARGYLNRTELTAERFIHLPYEETSRVYRSGDLGRWLADGNVEYLGRLDDQVKIRGYRIEPGEIEHVLQDHEDVAAAVVAAQSDGSGGKELVAYIVSDRDITVTDIRSYLSRRLPEYMQPSHYVQLPELPLTASGKVDRKRLPSLAAGSLLSGAAYVAPRNTTEEQLVEIWQEVLGRGNIGIKDNFFDAGGHSLKATRLVSLVHRTFDVKLELKDVFTYVTPETQADFIQHSRKEVFSSILSAPEAADYPLSSSQRRLWVLSQFEESNVAYNMPGVYLFEGGLDRDALSAAFAGLISRHEILRTVFRENAAGEIRQHILPSSAFRISYLDLRDASDQEEQLSELIQTMFTTPFNLSDGPLLRAGLYEISSGQWVFVYVMHHIISDGWSMEVLIRELLGLYHSSVTNVPLNLPSLRIQYKDYAVWQQGILTGTEPDAHKAYWLSEFSGELPVLSLLTDKPRPAIRTYNGGVVHRELDMQVYEGLKSLTGDHGSTLFMGLLAAVNVLLHRYTQQEDIIIGSPLAAREHIDLSDQIGFYANTLAIRSRFSGTDNYVHILEGVKEKTIGAYTHQAYPFDELVTSLSLQRDMSRHPLFDIEVILQQAVSVNRSGGDQAGELKVSPYNGTLPQQSRFDIVFNFTEDVSGLKLSIDYNIDLYEASTIARLAAHTEQMLSAIVTSPYAAISGLDYLEAAERQQLLHTFNAANDPLPSADTLVSLFRRQVLLTPAAVAVVYGDKHLTYQELDEKSGLLASHIKTYNHFAQGSLVGVLQDRSELLLISILGILKAGGVYVPIDPSYPSSRKSFILSDTGARLLLTQTSYLFDVDYYEGDLFAMDVQLDGLQNVLSADVPIMGSDLAYVIYTSGSTGIPKGVMIDHGAISNTIRAQQEAFGTLPGERHLQFASSSFDASVSEIFVSLCSGGELHIIDDAMKQSPELLYGYISTQDISIATLPPAYLQQAFAHGLPALNKLVTAGEAAVVSQALSFGKQGIYYNAYGPTETSICATVFRLFSSWDGRSGIVPVGRPLPNVRIYILDERHQLCPVGVAGEICIAGAGVARGYLNRTELTAERFIHLPYEETSRVYRSGDLGRWLADGNIEYLGRLDDQVKIRGYRIEPGEIEHVLQDHEDVAATVVAAQADGSGGKELVAYIVSDRDITVTDIRSYLSRRLPEYMQPSHYVQLPELPLTASGKVDRKRLPSLAAGSLLSGAAYVAPRNTTEEQLVEIWQEVLGRGNIGIKDNFFDAGGHSLKATRLVSLVHRTFDVKLELKDVFTYVTPETQADFIQHSRKEVFSSIPSAPEAADYPLSSSQRRLWVLSQFEESNIAYNIPGAYLFEGELDCDALSAAFAGLISRHEILRTVFRENAAGEIRQHILPASAFRIPYLDLREAADREEQLSGLIRTAFVTPFNLSDGPLLRVGLYEISSGRWVFVYVMHHIISDGWSMEVLIRELLGLYHSSVTGVQPNLPSLRIQYKDYAVWQQSILTGAEPDAHKAYWLSEFSGELPVLSLLTDKPRPAVKTYNGGVVHRELDMRVYEGLKSLTGDHGSTLFMGLLATVNVLLHRYTQQEDIIIGSPVAGREHADLSDQIGFYVNTLALRTRLHGKMDFFSLLDNVRTLTLGAYAHQAFPFDELVDALPLPRDMSRHPLFDVMVVLQQHTLSTPGDTSLLISEYAEDEQPISKFDLQFTFLETAGGLRLSLTYNTDLYEQATAERLSLHLESLLAAVLALPATPIGQIDFLSKEEKELLQYGFNDTAAVYPHDKTLTALFEEQAFLMPAGVAVIFEDRTLSYRELNEEANRLGHYLRAEYSIGAEDLVVVQLERSEWLVIALLGVLKSGGAYVPLDPAYPPEHRDYILSDSDSRVVLDEAELQRFRLRRHTYSSGNPVALAGAESLAYVIYTSGSTGRPKGCMLEHGGVVNRLSWMWEHYGFDSSDVVLQKTSFTFDVSVWELFLPLCWGAQLVLCRREDAGVPDRICSLIRVHGVTSVHFVPGMLHAFIASLSSAPEDLSGLKSLRRVITSGEALSLGTVRSWYRLLNVPLHNLYGPTEASIDVSWYATAATDIRIPIGRPVQNIRLYITAPDGQLQPIGAIGEICIAGVGVARGYLNRAELTAEKFIRLPYEETSSVYRSGDLGRWLPDGNIEYLGRMDGQVKIRGYRIEPGEIEHALQGHKDVAAAAVVALPDSSGEKELVAYIVSSRDITVTDIREYLGRYLPAYMVPGHFIQLPELPLTASGKVDRKRLPLPEAGSLLSGTAYVAPRNTTEKQLVEIWQEVLGRGNIGIKDNFFDAGGHSLKATRLVSLVHRTFDVKLALKDVFTYVTPETQADFIQRSHKEVFTAIPSAPEAADYPLSSSQRRLWVLSQFEESNVAYNMPGIYLFEGDLDHDALSAAFTGLISRHEILRTVFRENAAGEIRQHILPSSAFRISYLDLRESTRPEEQLSELIRTASATSFNLSDGPLLRAGLYEISSGQWVFVYVMHHIISDGWSMEVLIRELLGLYQSSVTNVPLNLPSLRIQYKDYAVWQQSILTGAEPDAHKAYWLSEFSGELPVLSLLTDKPRPVIKTYNGGVVHRELDRQVYEGLKSLTGDHGSTLFMGLLAAVNVLLHRYTQQEDIIIGSPVAGREHADLSDQIGFYVNTLALRTRLNGTMDFLSLLDSVRTLTLGAYAHQAFPFDELVDALPLPRDMSRHPLFDVMVVLQQHTLSTPGDASLRIREYAVDEQLISKFDLQFTFLETADGLRLSLTYNTDLYEQATAERLSSHLESLLAAVLALPTTAIGQIDFLSREEKELLQFGFNDTAAVYPHDKTLTALFEEQASLRPAEAAVIFEDRTLSYHELNEEANRLGHYLRAEYGIGAEDLVVVQLERSEWLVIALLGVLKSGGAYVPLDPAYPPEHRDYILSDSGSRVVLDEAELQRFRLQRDSYDSANPVALAGAENLAYVIYTSGSTGRPKGCMLEHGGVVNRLSWMWEHYGFDCSDVVLQKTSFTFDVSVWELFLPLCWGARLVMCRREDVGVPDRICSLIRAHGVTSIHFVPGMLHAFIASLPEDLSGLQSLRRVITSGEALSLGTVRSWYRLLDVPLHNLYGPTEASIDVSWYATAATDVRIPIGRPVQNIRLYITAPDGQLQPIGAVGEICIAGVGVARGYLNRAELTTEKFIHLPYEESSRVYRSGDLGRWLPDGNIEYLGRMDGQVKIRGYRIELGEIEHVLQGHEDVAAAVVTALPDSSGGKELVAYIVSDKDISVTDIRSYLGRRLPEYMVPSLYMQLPELPLTTSGKVDRKRLPLPEAGSLLSGAAYVAPRNTTEEQLVGIWQEVLGRGNIGIKDNFFELGGHSIKATKLITQVKREFKVDLSLSHFFGEPTIETLAEKIHNDKWLQSSFQEQNDGFIDVKI
ncbi:non-ribosomal peptide synthase/polyketide synthase [Chitinophaga flava]|uniref:Carrier domain-containing protein n=1 Tax=Chitinophaga flava TaxID=2259036 RepID=A0A365XVZ6_9BACT|nr:non-ribosomal peptide synthase/polyketide synthase [Chitinophaga flava]RBL90503.1 hypothetical protein DF182_29035 [Chitinophaga flava]